MALDKQTVSLSLVKGVDTKSDSKQQVPGSLVLLENGRFTSVGQIQKRPGHDALGQGIIGGSESITKDNLPLDVCTAFLGSYEVCPWAFTCCSIYP